MLITVSVSLCISKKNNYSDGITAKEGYSKALEEALKWNQSAKLIQIRKNSQVINGKASQWRYNFGVNNDKNNSIDIIVCVNGTVFSPRIYRVGPNYYFIENWTIDSDEAYNIAMSNPTIKTYLNKYGSDVHIYSFILGTHKAPGELYNKTVWGIEWYGDVTGDEDYKGAEIDIDAITGEVLYVKADK